MTTDSPTPGGTPPDAAAPRDLTALNAYVTQYYGKYTDAALIDHLMGVGHQRADIEAAIRSAAAADRVGPVNARAKMIVRLGYLITYALLVAGMLFSSRAFDYGAGVIGTIVLTVVLGVAFLISAGWLGWRGSRDRGTAPGMLAMLAIPLVLLVLVAGACLATGLPLPTAV
jgi:hypothetical protein